MHIQVVLVVAWLFLFPGCREFEKGRENSAIQFDIPTSTPTERLSRLYYISLEKSQENLPTAYKESFPWLLKASEKMDEIFWEQAYGNPSKLFPPDQTEGLNQLINLNYGPYDRLDDNAILISGIDAKNPGANFYPGKMADSELTALRDGLSKLTMIRRDESGKLVAIPYAEYFKSHLSEAADHLRMAARFMEEGLFKEFLLERAQALESDQYLFSDGLWLGLWDEALDILIGPIESYEDALKGVKSSYQSCIVQKDPQATAEIRPLLELLPKLSLELDTEIRYERGELPKVESVGV